MKTGDLTLDLKKPRRGAREFPRAKTRAEAGAADTDCLKRKPSEREQVIRDGFSMPASDYALIEQLRKRALEDGEVLNKSELVRAGLKALTNLPHDKFLKAVRAVGKVKTGRPATE